MIRLPEHRSPTHPGEMPIEEHLEPHGLTRAEAASRLGISRKHLGLLLNGRRGVTADTALRLGRLFGASAESWLMLQLHWDLWHALHSPAAADIERVQPMEPPGA